jgi:OOP family OmpA-OmpF porin
MCSILQAQDENNPWVISLGVNAVDTYPVNTIDFVEIQDFYNPKNFNALPTLTSLSVNRHISSRFSLLSRFSMNRLTKIGDQQVDGLKFASFDLAVRNSLAKKGANFAPFAEVGGGQQWLDGEGSFVFSLGLGLGYWLNDNIGFTYQTSYREVIENEGIDHFQHLVGLNVKFGGIDTDGDGVYDKNDICPEVPGLEEFDGCPDSDGDGITDKDDACPNRAGTADMGGCPDSDSDGIADPNDGCPNLAGTKAMGGCPDSDGDGIADPDDNCPNEAGHVENNGCPFNDIDGDGILDKDDACPNLAGVPENNGCPKIPQDVISTLNSEGSMIRFKASSAEITGEDSKGVIQNIKDILASYPTVNFVIEGHASSDGSTAFNKALSQRRAEAVENELINLGVNQSRIETVAFGESMPIADNNTVNGRRSNRRVQFSVGKE